MGTNSSKSEAQSATLSRKSLRSRSSLNILKRTRTSSNAATKPQTQPPAHHIFPLAEQDIDVVTVVPQPAQLSQSTCNASHSPSPLSSMAEDVHDASESGTAASEASHSIRPHTPVNIERDALSVSGSENSRTGTPALSLTPKTRPKTLLPQPSMLSEDSPTKYGLRDMFSPAPDIPLLTQAQRKKMTGPELFARSAWQLKKYHNARELDADKRIFSHSSPNLLFAKKPEHAQQPPVWSSRREPCNDLLYNAMLSHRVVHALPMLVSQSDCLHQHSEWHAASQPGYNVSNPVSCTVCDGYSQELAGDDFRRCNWCWLIVCGKCHHLCLRDGVEAMMSKQAGTPDTGSPGESSVE